MIVETWLPTDKGKVKGGLKLQSTGGAHCFQNGGGLTLLLDENGSRFEIYLHPTKADTFARIIPHTSAGTVYFRRIAPNVANTING